MNYVLMEESLFRSLMGRILNQVTDVSYRFSESDYWMNGKEVCEFLNISHGLLNAFRKNNMLFFCRIKDVYHYKRAEVYKMKTTMDKELVDSGAMLGGCRIINTESEALKVFEENIDDLPI
ncbi:MAG: hypothetical protein LBI82_04725 [Dysgonamonadaceae bacterium]|jgi:hypothetical protein|nr:hypothetical protein [Dysgonamonadaceae bacterium]